MFIPQAMGSHGRPPFMASWNCPVAKFCGEAFGLLGGSLVYRDHGMSMG